MDFRFGEKAERLRKEIREFVKEVYPPDYDGSLLSDSHDDKTWEFSMWMAKKLSQKGWLTLTWPKEYGGMQASLEEELVYNEEMAYWGVPGGGMGAGGTDWVGPSLIMFGTEEQKRKYLPLISSADPDGVWCTGYSEPNAGSDFANLQIRAERKGDEYVINGQKIWTSEAHRARWCWLAVRTDPEAEKKHNGISVVIVDMKSKGVTVRPILTYWGLHTFNEVFFTDVRVPVENLVGEENRGWYQLMQALSFERGSIAGMSGYLKRVLDELVHYSKEAGLIKNPIVRQKLASTAVEIETLQSLTYETAWKADQGVPLVHEPSRDKLFRDMAAGKLAVIGTEILGAYSQLDPLNQNRKWTKLRGMVEDLYWFFPGISTGGGTPDTMRNIVGQYGLDLPRSY